MNNQMELTFTALAENEAFARMVVSAFLVRANPTLGVLSEVRTAVSEAVTNAIVHAYDDEAGKVRLRAAMQGDVLRIEVEDYGRGMEDVNKAMEPFYTTQPDKERTGMGFSLMQSFMDSVEVQSAVGSGTLVVMCKRLAS